jgi:hypothetical protein
MESLQRLGHIFEFVCGPANTRKMGEDTISPYEEKDKCCCIKI